MCQSEIKWARFEWDMWVMGGQIEAILDCNDSSLVLIQDHSERKNQIWVLKFGRLSIWDQN